MYVGQIEMQSLLNRIRDVPRQPEDVFVILLAEQTKPDLHKLVATLNDAHIPFMGGVFPGVIHHKLYREGAVILRMPACNKPIVIQNLEDVGSQLGFSRGVPDGSCSKGCPTAVVLVDGFAPNISRFLDGLSKALGPAVHYVGGGCGSVTLRQEPCLFSEEGVFQNAALVMMTPMGSTVGIQHGWRRLTGPLTATKTQRNIIHLLNGRTAFDVYKEIVEKDSKRTFTSDNFYAIAQEYPFGIVMNSDEDLVRDPIAAGSNGELICIGDVPENAALNILKGQKSALIAAAGRAAGYLCRKTPKLQQCLLFDCVSRSLYLDQSYAKELDMIHNSLRMIEPSLIAEGALSMGEIASTDQKELKFFNKTTVVGGLFELKP
jgi:hypothetical protein